MKNAHETGAGMVSVLRQDGTIGYMYTATKTDEVPPIGICRDEHSNADPAEATKEEEILAETLGDLEGER